jgi:hypothetical protein
MAAISLTGCVVGNGIGCWPSCQICCFFTFQISNFRVNFSQNQFNEKNHCPLVRVENTAKFPSYLFSLFHLLSRNYSGLFVQICSVGPNLFYTVATRKKNETGIFFVDAHKLYLEYSNFIVRSLKIQLSQAWSAVMSEAVLLDNQQFKILVLYEWWCLLCRPLEFTFSKLQVVYCLT